MNNHEMNELIRGTVARRRQPRDNQGRFAAEEHENPDVPKLLKLRALSAEAGDHQGVGEMNQKLRAIDPQLAPPPDAPVVVAAEHLFTDTPPPGSISVVVSLPHAAARLSRFRARRAARRRHQPVPWAQLHQWH